MPYIEPPTYTIIVTCPACRGAGGKPARWSLVKGQRVELPAEVCSYCKGQKTVQAKTEPR